jgi:hypothetical protein
MSRAQLVYAAMLRDEQAIKTAAGSGPIQLSFRVDPVETK